MNCLTLKWGTLKSWDFSDSEEGQILLRKYFDMGGSVSAAMQNDTDKQKEIICNLIDLCDGDTIYLDWDGKEVSKQEAKDYVMNYRR
jgi:hypothetical protein